MKKDIHPKFNTNAKVTCVCGNSFISGSVNDEIHVELCDKCHPFYTGKMRIVDTASLVKKFEARRKGADKTASVSKRDKRASRREKRTGVSKDAQSLTLKDMLSQMS